MVPIFDEMNSKDHEQVVIKGMREISQLRNVYLHRQNPMRKRGN